MSSNDPELKKFVHRFLQDDILTAGFKTITSIFETKPKSVADYFAKEDTAIEYLHPNFLVLIVKILLECRFENLLQSNNYLPTTFLLAILMFVKFWTTPQAKN